MPSREVGIRRNYHTESERVSGRIPARFFPQGKKNYMMIFEIHAYAFMKMAQPL